MKKLLLLLLLILIGCSEPEPIDIKILDFKKNEEDSSLGTYYYLNEPYSGPFFERIKDKNEFASFYYIGKMDNGIKHGDIIKFKDENENPILRNTYNNGKIIGPLVFYDFDGEEYLFDNFMFKVESSSDSDTIMTELLDREIVIYLDTKNSIYKTYLKELKPDSLEIDNSGIKSLKNKSDFGSEYDKWYLYSKSKIIPKSPEEFSTSEQYFFFDLIRELLEDMEDLDIKSDISFKIVEPNKLLIQEKSMYKYQGLEETTTQKYLTTIIKIDSLIFSLPEINIPKNLDSENEVDRGYSISDEGYFILDEEIIIDKKDNEVKDVDLLNDINGSFVSDED